MQSGGLIGWDVKSPSLKVALRRGAKRLSLNLDGDSVEHVTCSVGHDQTGKSTGNKKNEDTIARMRV